MNVLNILMIVSLSAVVASLVFGLFSLIKGGTFEKKYGNRAMHWRVLLQGFALIIFFIILWLKRSS